MAAKKRGLGRGLDALLAGGVEVSREQAEAEGSLEDIPVEQIRPGRFQPRREFDPEALEALAQSIRAQGVIQPIVVRQADEGYELIAGERRWRAVQIVGLPTIPAVIRPLEDQAALAVALIENIQRESLNPIEEALALHRLIEECGLTHQACAESVGRSRAAVSNLLRLLELEDEIRSLVQSRALEMGHARALLGAPATQRLRLAHEVVARKLSVRQTEALVRDLDAPAKSPNTPPPVSDHLVSLGRKLGGRINAKVELQQKGRDKGRIVINYGSMDELEDILRELT
ncbi:MAG: ParB/RepB/Spo0J family partition protein [Abyssibacter sp.]|uniref:ParB/RepB/Spo0J family partition protein n=1 Tax=Abyssibacter sp. TaxID=2320200 RepID=UPI00321B0D95